MNFRRAFLVVPLTVVFSGVFIISAPTAVYGSSYGGQSPTTGTGSDGGSPRNTIELDPGGNFANNSKIGSYVVEEYGGAWGGPTGGPVLIAAQIINVLLQLLGLMSLLLILYGGFIWMLSRGNEDEVKKAKDIIIGTTIGLLVILASYSFMRFVFEAALDATDAACGILC